MEKGAARRDGAGGGGDKIRLACEPMMGRESAIRPLEDLGFGSSVPLSACEHRSRKIAERLGVHASVGLTVSTCSGTDLRSVERGRLGAAVESMEGAGVAHVCGVHHVPWVQLRCVSNYTGNRTASTWRLDEALAKLGQAAALVTRMEDLV